MKARIASFAVAAFAAVSSPAFAGESMAPVSYSTAPVGSVQLSGGDIAAGIGYMWGDGTLTFGNRKHGFTINGLSILDVGASSLSGSGEVYHLKKLSDFNGDYVAVSAGAAVAGGVDAIYLKNQHGVVIKLSDTEIGLRFNLAASGLDIVLRS